MIATTTIVSLAVQPAAFVTTTRYSIVESIIADGERQSAQLSPAAGDHCQRTPSEPWSVMVEPVQMLVSFPARSLGGRAGAIRPSRQARC